MNKDNHSECKYLKMEESLQKITRSPKRLLKRESLSPLAKRLQKTQSFDKHKKLDAWLIKKLTNNGQQENDCSSLKLSKTGKLNLINQSPDSSPKPGKSINLDTRSRNINRQENITKPMTLRNKKELSLSPKVADKTQNESIKNSRSLKKSGSRQVRKTSKSKEKVDKPSPTRSLNKIRSPQLRKTSKSNQNSLEKVDKPSTTKSFQDVGPTTRKLREKKPEESKKKLDGWLKKDSTPSPKKNSKKLETSTISQKTDSIKQSVTKTVKNSISRKEKVTKTIQKSSSSKQKDLKTLFKASSSKPAFKRNNSSDSCDLPTFANILNNKSTKSKKVTTTKKEQKAMFKKYGVHIPTVDEILRDKESLERDKSKIEQFIPIDCDSFEFKPFLEQAPQEKENILHCKHLTNQQLLKLFKKNREYLSSIFSGEVKNERHAKYFDKNRVITNYLGDLTYNTSTILFTYDQKEYLIDLLKDAFDPDDKHTRYFFQVLLPEFCLKIFMETYKMNHEAAVKHLDKQPVVDN